MFADVLGAGQDKGRAPVNPWPEIADRGDAELRLGQTAGADQRESEQSDELLCIIAFWNKAHCKVLPHLVNDSTLTTYKRLVPSTGRAHRAAWRIS
jgi:hypothetical protein